MPRDLASALQDALSAKEVPRLSARRIEGRSVFMSGTRRRLFQYITDMPAASLREIERALELSIPSVKWHVERLKDFSVLMEEPYKNLSIIYPSGLITSFEARILSSLRNETVRGALELIAASPGIDTPTLCDRLDTYSQRIHIAARELLSLGLISSDKIGHRRRYFPDHEFLSQIRDEGPRSDYLVWLSKWMENDPITITDIREEDGYGFMEMELPGKDSEVMRINLLPYRNLLNLKNAKSIP